MSGEQQAAPEPHYPNGPVLNYGAMADYEPRITDPTGQGRFQAWGRGVPTHLFAYVGVAFVVLLVITNLGPLGVVFGIFGPAFHVFACLAAAVTVSGWVWAMPPGGVRIHRALPAIWRGALMPRTLSGWQPVGRVPAGWAPSEVVMEPDFAGRWPRTQVTGPAQLVRTQAASREVYPGARPGEVGVVLTEGRGPRRGGPVVMDVPAGHVVELRPGGQR
jgi:hypothetical protein